MCRKGAMARASFRSCCRCCRWRTFSSWPIHSPVDQRWPERRERNSMKAWFGWIGIGIGVAIAGASAGALKLRNERPIVVVNGEKISRGQFIAEMEVTDGANVLRRMIREKLIRQAAAKKGLTPTPAQVQAEIANLK